MGDAFVKVCRNGEIEGVRKFLAEGADPNATNQRGFPVLFIAAEFGHTSVIELLLSANASGMRTPRHVAYRQPLVPGCAASPRETRSTGFQTKSRGPPPNASRRGSARGSAGGLRRLTNKSVRPGGSGWKRPPINPRR